MIDGDLDVFGGDEMDEATPAVDPSSDGDALLVDGALALKAAPNTSANAVTREQRRSRRKREVRARTISVKRMTKRELEIGRMLYPESDYYKPATRAECAEGARPCPYVSCQHHLFLDVSSRTGAIKLNRPIVDILPTASGRGYWLIASDGGVFAFGDAPFLGSAGPRRKLAAVVGITGGLGGPRQPGIEMSSRYGNDISWPQCNSELPAPPFGHGIVGVTGGRPFTTNPCLDRQHAWSLGGGSGAGLYVNLAYPKDDALEASDGPRGRCEPADRRCRAHNYGANTISHALGLAAAAGASAPMWWLDVESANRWSSDLGANQDVILGAVAALREADIAVGVYSTRRMWRNITGDMQIGLPVWVAGAPSDEATPRWCDPQRSFGGGAVWLVQSLPVRYDVNWACDPLTADPAKAFRFSS